MSQSADGGSSDRSRGTRAPCEEPLTSRLSFGSALDRLSTACLCVDVRGLVRSANEPAYTLLGIRPDRVTRPNLPALLAPTMISECFRFLKHASQSKTASCVVRHRDGQRLRLQGARGEEEGTVLLSVLEVDPPGQIITDDQIRAKERLVSRMPMPFLVLARGCISEANESAQAFLGNDIVGQEFVDYVANSCRTKVRLWLGPHLPQQPGEIEIQLAGIEGPRACRCTFMQHEQPGTQAVACFIHDKTDRREVEAQLMNNDRLNTVGTLASGVAHELNNPLTYVMMNLAHARTLVAASAASMSPPIHNELLDALRVAHDGAKRMTWIVEDLQGLVLDDDASAEVDVNSALVSAIDLTRARWRSCAVLTRQLGLLRPATGSTGRVTQVVINLVLNACEAIPAGEGAIHISTACSGGEVVISVRDNGAGVSPDIADRIFEPFVSTKEVGDGTGLGLYVCHQYVNECGGRIEFSALPTGGTEFKVFLRQAPNPSRTFTGHEQSPDPGGLAGLKLLVIDDEPLIRQGLARWFATSEVTLCDSGAEAIARIRSGETYDLILCDLYMPRMTGREVYERLGKLDGSMQKRFAVMTGGAVDPRDREFLEDFAPPVLHKPFTSQEVLSFVLQALSRFEPGGSSEAPASNDTSSANSRDLKQV